MNFKGYVGWGFYGASTSEQRANLWASWGLPDGFRDFFVAQGHTEEFLKADAIRGFWWQQLYGWVTG